jgi:hypothetical protein
MNKKIFSILIIMVLPIFSHPAFGRSIISGQVVDAETEKPIEGAAVFIEWTKRGPGPPGLAGEVTVEVAETLTDSEGRFAIPKYSTWFKDYTMAVYKNGYVCWSNWKIFPGWKDRKGFKLKNKMLIKIERFKEEYSKLEHADFTSSMALGTKGGDFSKAIEREIEMLYEKGRENRGK